MSEAAYREYDQRYYDQFLDDVLPPTVLDFHAHAWQPEDFRLLPWQTDLTGGQYFVVDTDYPVTRLMADGALLFPGRRFQAVCFGYPTPAADLAVTNAHLASLPNPDCYPLMVMGMDDRDEDATRSEVVGGSFWGYKVYLPWYGNDYGDVSVHAMLSEAALAVADELRLVVMLHVPGSERLAHPRTQAEVREIARRYPNAQFVLAHCGRCFLPRQMMQAIDAVKDLENVYLDTSGVMDPSVLAVVLQKMDSRRLLFATDLPVAMMRGCRVSVATHWVDLVLDEGHAPSKYRVAGDNFEATFMGYEMVSAVLIASELAGLSVEATRDIFYANGRAVLDRVRRE